MESKKFEDFEKEAKQYKKILLDYKRTQKPFVDPNFHPKLQINERDIDIDDSMDSWKRIDEICDVPLFNKDLINPDFVQQGELGDCYFLSALSRIAKQSYLVPLLFDRATPDLVFGRVKDSINIKCGAVVIYFNCFGRKTPVLIDTLLPTKNGRLRFSHPLDNTKSPWFCLVEKAYAKLNDSYSNIIGGTLPQAIYSIYSYYPSNKDFEDLRKPEKLAKMTLFDRIMKYQKKGAVMGTSINLSKLQNGVTKEEVTHKGLIPHHCYLLLKAREHDRKRFFCLRNPWGDHEWNGDYSDESPKWTPELKEGLSWKNADDGTFWMSDSDFFRYFTSVEVSLPLKPEWYSRHYYVQLKPGDHDGYNVEGSNAKIAERPNFAFQVIDPIEKGENCRFHILVEKRQKLFDDKKGVLYNQPKYCVLLAHSNGKKLSPDVLMRSNRYQMQSSMSLLCFAYEVSGNDDIVTIVLHRLQKCNLIEDCYVHVFCEKNFDLYDIDHPDELIPEDVTSGIVFDNFSVKHPKVASPLKLKKIKNKDVVTFGSMTGNDLNPLREELIARYREEVDSNRNEQPQPQKTQPRNKSSSEQKSSQKVSDKNSKAECYMVVSDLKCKDLISNGRPANDSSFLIRFHLDDETYQTNPVNRNSNPEFNEVVMAVKDLKIGGCLIIDIMKGSGENMTNFCSSLRLPLNGMEINPLMTYTIESSVSSSNGQNSGNISFSAKLCLEEDLKKSTPITQPAKNDTSNKNDSSNSDFVLEFTIDEASCNNGKNVPNISCALGSNENSKLDVKPNTNYSIKIGDPKSESIIFCFNDESGKNITDRIRVRLAQMQLDAQSVMETDMSMDDNITGHLKVNFSLKKP